MGVLLSAGTVLVVQGALTLGARLIEPVVTDAMISAATATGGILIFGLGLTLLELKEIRVANMLPALLLAPVLVAARRSCRPSRERHRGVTRSEAPADVQAVFRSARGPSRCSPGAGRNTDLRPRRGERYGGVEWQLRNVLG